MKSEAATQWTPSIRSRLLLDLWRATSNYSHKVCRKQGLQLTLHERRELLDHKCQRAVRLVHKHIHYARVQFQTHVKRGGLVSAPEVSG
jgi:hypothetical protein